jgi:iron complex transport system substrate-binding protein
MTDTNKSRTKLRVISLLPSATELLCAIGAKDLLVGRSHEDNYPADITDRPIMTSKKTVATTPAEIDKEVSLLISQGKSLYGIESELLESLKPDVILTQDVCNVCAIELVTVERLAAKLNPRPRVISLNPECLEDVISSAEVLGKAIGYEEEAALYIQSLEERIERVKSLVKAEDTPVTVGFIEWGEPIYLGGHWTPQIISFAGGYHTLNPAGHGASGQYVQAGGAGKSFPVPRDVFVASDPDVLIVAPCGFDLEAAIAEAERLLTFDWFSSLRAVRNGRLFVVDGDMMFNRPGPHLVNALEWLAAIFHPGNEDFAKLLPPDFPYKHLDTVAVKSSMALGETTVRAQAEVSIEEAHLAACQRGESMYLDPKTGLSVFTELTHLKRGKCCGNKCRHCPFGHYNVEPVHRTRVISKVTLLNAVTKRGKGVYDSSGASSSPADVLFWSGGKDSYLAYLRLCARTDSDQRRIVLLTTINEIDGSVPHQGTTLHQVMDQSRFLGVDHLIVPLPNNCSNVDYISRVEEGLAVIERKFGNFSRLIFGDLHLEDLVAWRKGSFPDREILFPLLNAPYEELIRELLSLEEVCITVTASTPESGLSGVGDIFDSNFLGKLAPGCDHMGERGEFHTHVEFMTSGGGK